jgi:predicted RND superfamily exporter protein
VNSRSTRAANRFILFVTKRPFIVLALTVVITGFALSQMVDIRTGAPRLLLDPSTDSMLSTGNPERLFFERMKLVFGRAETLLVALVSDDVFTSDRLRRISVLTERIESLDEVDHVSSLSTALNIRSRGDDLLIDPFYDEAPTDAEGLADLRMRALGDPIYGGNLVSSDGRIAVIAVTLLDLPEQELLDSRIDDRIHAIALEEAGDGEIWMAGAPHIKAETSRLMMEDVFGVVPLAFIIMAAIAFLAYRTIRGVVIPALTVGVASIWTLGYVAAFYGVLNPVTVAAPPILIVVGFAYSIHVLSAYYDILRRTPEDEREAGRAVMSALRTISMPVTLTAITTAAGFFSLMLSPIQAIEQFGAFCGIGVLVTAAISLTTAPAILALLPLPRNLDAKSEPRLLNRFLEWIAHFDLRNRRRIIAFWAVVAVLSVWGATRIEVGNNLVGNFKASNPVRQDFDRVNAHLEGANAFTLVVESPSSDAFKDPTNLLMLESLQEWLERQPEVGGTTSLADYIKAIHRGFRSGDDAFLALPDSRDLVAQLLVIGANDELEQYVDTDYRLARIIVRTRAIDSPDLMGLVRRIEDRLAIVPPHFDAKVSGSSVLLARTMDEIAIGQAVSLSAALLIIYAILALLFTSFRIGLLALIPNALPVLVYFGVLGWAGVTLNVVTGLVGCLVLGIAVDDTIHMLVHFKDAARGRANESEGIVEAIMAVGRPISFTTLALCLGFLVLLLSNMKSQVEFGVLASITLAIAWIIDLTFTPAIAGGMRIVTLWEVLTLDLGEDPHLSIPLFAGLSHAQARVTALMADLRDLPPDHLLVHEGESGDDMFVVIRGSLVASIKREGRDAPLRELNRGDVIGEVAIFFGERTADVRTLTDVRLLRLDRSALTRLSNRYPKIASHVYENLSEVLAARLASLTRRI